MKFFAKFRKMIHRFREDRQGGMAIVILGLMFLVMFIAMILLELLRYHESYYAIETAIQRSLTAAVEMNMDYRYRSDHILYLYIDAPPVTDPRNYEWNLNHGQGAYLDFLDFLAEDLDVARSNTTFTRKTDDGQIAYSVQINNHGGDDRVPCGDHPYVRANYPDSPENPEMWVSGTITMYPIFAGIVGSDPIVTEFNYASHNFRIDGT